jgi:predicted molibdopterin-dependent oxidoreductase YjgC
VTSVAQFVRLVARERPAIAFTLDGEAATARQGDTILTAVLALRRGLPASATEPHAGFCLMGACQECWVTADARPVRACGTLVVPGMQVVTRRFPSPALSGTLSPQAGRGLG